MANIPVTSISLLKAISESSDSVRWTEFYKRYSGAMHDFLRVSYPTVDADDAIQDAMIALMNAIPDYRQPADDGQPHFRRYLFGILAHKAVDHIRRSAKQSRIRNRMENESDSGLRMGIAAGSESASRFSAIRPPEECCPIDDEEWKRSVLEVAIAQLMADDTVQPVTRQVFHHVAVRHESPEDVASQFGLTRNNVDQIKNRMIGRLSRLVAAMTAVTAS